MLVQDYKKQLNADSNFQIYGINIISNIFSFHRKKIWIKGQWLPAVKEGGLYDNEREKKLEGWKGKERERERKRERELKN